MTAARVTACCTLGIAAVLFAAGAAAERSGGVDAPGLANDDLVARVEQAIDAETALAVERIAAEASGGVVTLRGNVSSPAGRESALHLARSVPGVQVVRDELRVGGSERRTDPARF